MGDPTFSFEHRNKEQPANEYVLVQKTHPDVWNAGPLYRKS